MKRTMVNLINSSHRLSPAGKADEVIMHAYEILRPRRANSLYQFFWHLIIVYCGRVFVSVNYDGKRQLTISQHVGCHFNNYDDQ